MKKAILVLVAAVVAPSVSFADNVGGCGLGSKLFDGKKGLFPQVLAITTNGMAFQTFAVTSGTSGCTRDGVVSSDWKSAAFIDSNMNKLAMDMSRGQGESLKSLATLMQVAPTDELAFNSTLQSKFGEIFSNPSVTSSDVASAIKNVLSSDERLSKYSANV